VNGKGLKKKAASGVRASGTRKIAYDYERIFGKELVCRSSATSYQSVATKQLLRGTELLILYYCNLPNDHDTIQPLTIFTAGYSDDTVKVIHISDNNNNNDENSGSADIPVTWYYAPSLHGDTLAQKLGCNLSDIIAPCCIVVKGYTMSVLSTTALDDVMTFDIYGDPDVYDNQSSKLVESWLGATDLEQDIIGEMSIPLD
jgi:hypothetical protein